MKDKPKILVICQHFWPESFRINDICDYLHDCNVDIDVLCGIPNYPKGKFYEGYSFWKNKKQLHDGVKIIRSYEIPRASNSNFRIFMNYISFPITSIFHIPRLLTRKYDKIFIYQLSPVMMAIAGIIIGKIKRTEIIMYVLDLWPENLYSVLNIKNRFLRALVKNISHWHYRQADKLIVLSDKMQEKIINITGFSKKKVIVLPQACEKIYETSTLDKQLSSKFSKGFNIVYTGNISPAQDFDTIVSAAKLLKESGITDINWVIVGDGMSRKSAETSVAKAGLSKIFFFEGQKPITDIPKYNAVANLLIGGLVKSDLLEATIPAKVMSYLASGKPIVLAMDGEVQELVNNKIKCGFAGPASDADALSENIKKMYRMPAVERRKMGEKGQAYHFKYFERNIILDKLYKHIFND